MRHMLEIYIVIAYVLPSNKNWLWCSGLVKTIFSPKSDEFKFRWQKKLYEVFLDILFPDYRCYSYIAEALAKIPLLLEKLIKRNAEVGPYTVEISQFDTKKLDIFADIM